MHGTSFAASFRMATESVTLHAGAIVSNGAFVDLMPTIFAGTTYVLLTHFDPVTHIEAVELEKATHVMLAPSQIIAFRVRDVRTILEREREETLDRLPTVWPSQEAT